MKKTIALCLILSGLYTCHVFSQVMLLTLPKTGTNLVLKLLRTMLNEKHQYNVHQITDGGPNIVWGHEWRFGDGQQPELEPNQEKIAELTKRGAKLILLLRDPRQHLTSLLRAIKKPVNPHTISWGIENFPEMMARQTGQKCFQRYQDIISCYHSYMRWANEYSNVYVTTYEKLVGSRGGASQALQEEEIKNIATFLGLSLDSDTIKELASGLYGNTSTFIEGKTSTWKSTFSLQNKLEFKQKAQLLLVELGYETSENW